MHPLAGKLSTARELKSFLILIDAALCRLTTLYIRPRPAPSHLWGAEAAVPDCRPRRRKIPRRAAFRDLLAAEAAADRDYHQLCEPVKSYCWVRSVLGD